MRIKDLCSAERPREKLARYGPGKLKDSELLAILLRTGKKGENAIKVASKLLRHFSGQGLAGASFAQLKNFPGMGAVKACEIVACFELGRRFLKGKKAAIFLKPEDVWNELKDIRKSKKEHFAVLYLDSGNQEVKRDIISIGTLNYNVVHPREVFEPAIRNLAASVIVAHNHPSGKLDPSSEDLALNKRLVEAGKILGIEVLDHVIVSSGEFLSFREKGLM